MKSRIHGRAPLRFRFVRDWGGDEAFIIGGGTSVQIAAVNALRDRPGAHVITLNSAYRSFPWAAVLFFADERWIREEVRTRPDALAAFQGEAFSILENPNYDHIAERVIRETSPGLSTDPEKVFLHYTAARGAMNMALHRGARRNVLVGIDNRDGEGFDAEGRPRVHFHEGYPWMRSKNTWAAKFTEFESTVEPLRAAGIEVINASPISTLPWWPKVDLAEWLKETPA